MESVENPIKKGRKLTRKQRGWVNDVADGKNLTEAAIRNYETDDRRVAQTIGSENLSKPIIQEELKKLGFDTNNAKRVVGEILNKEYAEDKDRLKAAEIVLKSLGEIPQDTKGNTYNFLFSADVQKDVKEIEERIKAKLLNHVK